MLDGPAVLAEIVARANDNLHVMDGTTEPVRRILAGCELVFGVWQDLREPHGVGTSIIKGVRRLKAIAESGERRFVAGQQRAISLQTKWSAIKCESAEQAAAARLVLGDRFITEAFVYVMKSEDGQIKVGRSNDPKIRRRNLQTGSPFPLALFHIEPCPPALAHKAELRARLMLSQQHFRGEWFDCTAEQAIEIVRYAVGAVKEDQLHTVSIPPMSRRLRR
jgi:hypothetical protein